jgi:tRNA(adenine34) deaminase
MGLALDEAKLAFKKKEVPIGAIITLDDKVISKGYNSKITNCDTTSHAEIEAIRKACLVFNDWRLEKTTIYVTSEPCIMCCGAIIHARISKVVFGCFEPKMGGVSSIAKCFDISNLHHKPSYIGGVLEEESKELLQCFFKELRNKGDKKL